MVHTPISVKKAMNIPAAKAALEKEWTKLESKNAWDLKNPREYYEVRDEANRKAAAKTAKLAAQKSE